MAVVVLNMVTGEVLEETGLLVVGSSEEEVEPTGARKEAWTWEEIERRLPRLEIVPVVSGS